MTVKIRLTGGQVMLVDDADAELMRRYVWGTAAGRKTTYARATVAGSQVLAHTLLLGRQPGIEVDHRNGNGLDNRRANLRLATPSQNRANRGAPRNNTSGYKGVSWHTARRKWSAQITTNRRRRHLGYFADPWLAAQAYNRAAVDLFGEFAHLNTKRPDLNLPEQTGVSRSGEHHPDALRINHFA